MTQKKTHEETMDTWLAWVISVLLVMGVVAMAMAIRQDLQHSTPAICTATGETK